MKKFIYTGLLLFSLLGFESFVSAQEIKVEPTIFIPNACTENHAGKRSYYVEAPICDAFEMTIYNKWGQLLFQTKDALTKWDFKVAGQLLPIDVYNCVVKVFCDHKCYTVTNTISLL